MDSFVRIAAEVAVQAGVCRLTVLVRAFLSPGTVMIVPAALILRHLDWCQQS
jgi:hypothetical protein